MTGQKRHSLGWSLRVSSTVAICLLAALGTGPLSVGAQNATPVAGTPIVVQAGALTQARPYLVASDPSQLTITPLLTSGETVGDYQMAGTPDGLGAYRDGNSVVVFMNHEWRTEEGEHITDARVSVRSEERRVGKECRSRWSQYH